MLTFDKKANKFKLVFFFEKWVLGLIVFSIFIGCAAVILLFVARVKEGSRVVIEAKPEKKVIEIFPQNK